MKIYYAILKLGHEFTYLSWSTETAQYYFTNTKYFASVFESPGEAVVAYKSFMERISKNVYCKRNPSISDIIISGEPLHPMHGPRRGDAGPA